MTKLDRIRGCLYGHLAGDALGSLVEFKSPATIAELYPEGVRRMRDGGTYNTQAGQPTDDGEQLLTLLRSIVACGGYEAEHALLCYKWWLSTGPFDCGSTTHRALAVGGVPDVVSQANGALMRAAALGVACAGLSVEATVRVARADCRLTHPSLVCQDVNALYVLAVARALNGLHAEANYAQMLMDAKNLGVDDSVTEALHKALTAPPASRAATQGWVLTALQNAVHQLLHARSFKQCIVRSIALGYDTDTNACIAGALYGATCGVEALPHKWVCTLERCKAKPGSLKPRPRELWPSKLEKLLRRLPCLV